MVAPEIVLVTQFGRPVGEYKEAGLKFKWPFQGLTRIDKRLHLYNPRPFNFPAPSRANEDVSCALSSVACRSTATIRSSVFRITLTSFAWVANVRFRLRLKAVSRCPLVVGRNVED